MTAGNTIVSNNMLVWLHTRLTILLLALVLPGGGGAKVGVKTLNRGYDYVHTRALHLHKEGGTLISTISLWYLPILLLSDHIASTHNE